MLHRIADDLMDVVEKTTPLLRAIDPAIASVKPSPTKWSIKEILGHLVDSASNNHQRFVRGQVVDELSSPGYEQEHWVSSQGYNEHSWGELIDFWRLYNRHLAQVIRRIPEEKATMTCRIGSYQPVTFGYLIEDYVVHLKHHVGQIIGSSVVETGTLEE